MTDADKTESTHGDQNCPWMGSGNHRPIAVWQGDPGESNTEEPAYWYSSAERLIMVAGEMQVDYKGLDPADAVPAHDR